MGLLPSGSGPKQLGSGEEAAGDGASAAARSDASDSDAKSAEDAHAPPEVREAELLEEVEKLERGGRS